MRRRISLERKTKILQLYYDGTPVKTICENHGIARSTLYKWTRDFSRNSMRRTKLQNSSPINVAKLISHTNKIEAQIEFLHRTIIKNIPLKERMKIIDNEYGKESLHVQCEALEVNRSSYLNHRLRNKNEDAWFIKREAEYTEIIRSIFENSGHVYGARKITAIMHKMGKPISKEYVRKIMVKTGMISLRSSADKTHFLISRQLRESAHSSQTLKPEAPNQVRVSDVTVFVVHNRHYYVCAYVDLFSRKLVSYGVGTNNSAQLVKRVFLTAYSTRKPTKLIIHTDNGSPYASYSFNKLLSSLNVKHSYSRPGIPHDNAVAESFFNTLKREGIFRKEYPRSFRELTIYLSNFMKWYNSERPHEHLHYAAPDELEAELIT